MYLVGAVHIGDIPIAGISLVVEGTGVWAQQSENVNL